MFVLLTGTGDQQRAFGPFQSQPEAEAAVRRLPDPADCVLIRLQPASLFWKDHR